jgi:predicted solute-binding protein
MFERGKDLLGLLSIHILLDDILDLRITYRRGVVEDVGKGCPVRLREKSSLETESLASLDPETLVGDDRLMESPCDPFVHVLDVGGVFWVEIPLV